MTPEERQPHRNRSCSASTAESKRPALAFFRNLKF